MFFFLAINFLKDSKDSSDYLALNRYRTLWSLGGLVARNRRRGVGTFVGYLWPLGAE
jgi:transposase InsO family protein